MDNAFLMRLGMVILSFILCAILAALSVFIESCSLIS